MTGKLMFVPDGWAVVPREPTTEMLEEIKYLDAITDMAMATRYRAMLSKSPQLTTPPVLRWEDKRLMLGRIDVAFICETKSGIWYASYACDWEEIDGDYSSHDEARRAAEKALGFPEGLIIPEV